MSTPYWTLSFTVHQQSYEVVADGWSVSPGAAHCLRIVSVGGPKTAILALKSRLQSADGITITVRDAARQSVAWHTGHRMSITVRPLTETTWHLVALDRAIGQTAAVCYGNTLAEAVLTVLQAVSEVPLLPEWAPLLHGALGRRKLLQPWTTHGTGPVGADFEPALSELPTLIPELVRQGHLPLPDGPAAPAIALDTIPDLDLYMTTFGPTMARPVAAAALHQPGTAPQYALPRPLYPAQADVAEALVKLWASGERVGWLIGRQGSGKSAIALATAWRHLNGRPGRIVVHCPDHLIPKWTREVAMVFPQAPVIAVHDWHDAWAAIPRLAEPPTQTEIWILPRDAGKLDFQWRPVAQRWDHEAFSWRCPACRQPLFTPARTPRGTDRPWGPKTFAHRHHHNRVCPHCGFGLWSADRSGPRRIAPSRLWAQRCRRGTFDVCIADEIHEEKGNTAQGTSLARLLGISTRALFLTGTLLGGKASDLYWLLARTQPDRMRAYGYAWGQVMPFIRTYGTTETVTESMEGGSTRRTVREQPGIHPAIFGDWLLGRAVFLELEDLHAHLPAYTESVQVVPMSDAQADAVHQVQAALRPILQTALESGVQHVWSSLLHLHFAYPDRVWADDPLRSGAEVLLTFETPLVDPDTYLPKELAVASTILQEKAQGRQCLLFVEYTQTYDVTVRLRRVLERLGLVVARLDAAVQRKDRDAWLSRCTADVVLVHPRMIATGLDALRFPTVLWYQTGYNLFTVRQASRRSWRLGQTQPVKVIFFAYEDTTQHTVLRVLANKQRAAEAIEGRFSAEGLQALASGENAALLVAQALVYGLEGLPDVRQVWHQMTPLVLEPPRLAEAVGATHGSPPPSTPAGPPVPVFTAGEQLRRTKVAPNQLLWF